MNPPVAKHCQELKTMMKAVFLLLFMPQLGFPMELISMRGVYGDEIINFTAINSVNVKRHDSLPVYDVFFVQCTFVSLFEKKNCDDLLYNLLKGCKA